VEKRPKKLLDQLRDAGCIRFADPTVMLACEALRMAMIEGARAIGPGDEVGSLDRRRQASRRT
jgi:hypothetical protein